MNIFCFLIDVVERIYDIIFIIIVSCFYIVMGIFKIMFRYRFINFVIIKIFFFNGEIVIIC